MSLQDVLTPGEKVLSECRPFYATSRRILRYDEGQGGGRVEELAYHDLAGVQVIRRPSHPMMIVGTLAVLSALYLATTRFIAVTAFPAALAGGALLFIGARGRLGYYQLHTRKAASAAFDETQGGWRDLAGKAMEVLGLRAPPEEARWRLDYSNGGSFIATLRTVVGELPEI